MRRYPPFYADDRMQLYQSILAGKIEYPRHMKKEARDLISKLLTADLSRRLGNLKGGGRDIRMHPWFKGFDWEALLQRTMPAPIQINPRSEDDTSMFDEYDDDDGPDVGAGKVSCMFVSVCVCDGLYVIVYALASMWGLP
jgi:hypothetical protein